MGYQVTIFSVNKKNKSIQDVRTEKDINGVARLLIQYKAKRGYEIVSYYVKRNETLV